MEDARARRERLRALREAAAAEEPAAPANGAAGEEPTLKFRNYAVKDSTIEHRVLEAAQPPVFEEPQPEADPSAAGLDEVCTSSQQCGCRCIPTCVCRRRSTTRFFPIRVH